MNTRLTAFTLNLTPRHPWPAIISVAVGLFIGFLAPFGMHELPQWLSMGYWSSTCLFGYFVFAPILQLCERYLAAYLKRAWQTECIVIIFSSMVFSLFIPWWNTVWFDITYTSYFTASGFVFLHVVVIGGIIALLTSFQQRHQQRYDELKQTQDDKQSIEQQLQTPALADTQLEAFMALLPIEKRGRLLCLQMDDHYVKVHTDKGHHLILLRFKDALSKLSHYPGLQVHRSCWVAQDAIVKMNKHNRKVSLVLNNSLEIPVSKTYEQQVKSL